MATLQDRFNINSQLEHLQVSVHGRASSCLTVACQLQITGITTVSLQPACASPWLSNPACFLQAKYVGTGHADLTRWEWAVNVHRDSYASYIGHHPQMAYFAVAENESIGRKKYEFLQKMLLPCGTPPKRADDEE